MTTGAVVTEHRPIGLLIAAGVLGLLCGLVVFVWFALAFLLFGAFALRRWRIDAVRLTTVFLCGFALGFATTWVMGTPVDDGESSSGVIESVADPQP